MARCRYRKIYDSVSVVNSILLSSAFWVISGIGLIFVPPDISKILTPLLFVVFLGLGIVCNVLILRYDDRISLHIYTAGIGGLTMVQLTTLFTDIWVLVSGVFPIWLLYVMMAVLVLGVCGGWFIFLESQCHFIFAVSLMGAEMLVIGSTLIFFSVTGGRLVNPLNQFWDVIADCIGLCCVIIITCCMYRFQKKVGL